MYYAMLFGLQFIAAIIGYFLGIHFSAKKYRIVGTLKIDTRNDDFDNYLLEVDGDLEEVKNMKYVSFRVTKVG